VLMACAQEGQTRPSLKAAADLLKGAARMRLRPMPGQPGTVFAAVWLMIAAAAAELGIMVTLLATESGIKADLIARYPAYAHAIGHAVTVQVTVDEIVGPIVIAVWLWMAWMSSLGKQRGGWLSRCSSASPASVCSTRCPMDPCCTRRPP
jgi:hypothetical protein